MTATRILNCLSAVAVFLTYLIAGVSGYFLALVFKVLLDHTLPGLTFPGLTGWVVEFAPSYAYIVINLIVGLLFAAVLFWMEFGDAKRKSFIPPFLAVALILNFLQVVILFWALANPFMYVTYGMTNSAK